MILCIQWAKKGVSNVIAKSRNSFEGPTGIAQKSESTPVPKVELETPDIVEECKLTIPAPSAVNPFAHTLSGTFSNYTIWSDRDYLGFVYS